MSPPDRAARAVVVGNLTVDELWRDGVAAGTACGGTARFAALALRALGYEVEVIGGVHASDRDVLVEPLQRAGVDVHGLRSTPVPSTRFRLAYEQGTRRERLVSPGPRCAAADLPSRAASASFVHLGGVAGELEADAVVALAGWGPPLGVDLHVLRRFDDRGQVHLVDAVASGFPFDRVAVVKGSLAELAAFAPDAGSLGQAMRAVRAVGAQDVLATDGSRGAVLLTGDELWLAPAFPVHELDATGAGDVFLATFLARRFAEGEDAVTAVALASAAASFAVSGSGIDRFADRGAIEARAVSVRARRPAEREARTWGIT